jgi:hypothetical protein
MRGVQWECAVGAAEEGWELLRGNGGAYVQRLTDELRGRGVCLQQEKHAEMREHMIEGSC